MSTPRPRPSIRLVVLTAAVIGGVGLLCTLAPWPLPFAALAQTPDQPDGGGEGPLAGGGGGTPPMPAPQGPGLPKPWEAGLQVSPYSTINLSNGNLVTVIPITGWSGLGPDISFTLYHNSLTAPDYEPPNDDRIDLGPGWSFSYSARILGSPTGQQVTLVEDDGSTVVFTWTGSVWDPEPGYYDVLTYDEPTWTLTRKNQWRWVFEFDGSDEARLHQIIDSADNALMVHYYTEGPVNRIESVEDAVGRSLECVYAPEDGPLAGLRESFQLNDPAGGQYQREWTIEYDGSSRVNSITDAESHSVRVTSYDTDGRILVIRDKADSDYTYAYSGPHHRISSVTDPYLTDLGTQYQQSFAYAVIKDSLVWPPANRIKVTHTDRRGSSWVYWFDYDQASRELFWAIDPLAHVQKFHYDNNLNLIDYYNELNRRWRFTYDTYGNLTSLTDPESWPNARVTWAYDSYNNLTSVADALGNQVSFVYEDADPTNVTEIHEPADGQGNEPAVTVLDYYADGLLHTVTDANNVQTEFQYDDYGQINEVIESWSDLDPEPEYPQYESSRWSALDAAGRPAWTDWKDLECGEGGTRDPLLPTSCDDVNTGMIWAWDANNRPVAGMCCAAPGGVMGCGEPWPPDEVAYPLVPMMPATAYEYVDGLCQATEAEYDGMGRPVYSVRGFEDQSTGEWWEGAGGRDSGPGQSSEEDVTRVYDELGRLTYMLISTTAPVWWTANPAIEREWNIYYDYLWEPDPVEQRYYVSIGGPDGEETRIYFDVAERVTEVRRIGAGGEMSATCQYYATGLPYIVTYGNGTSAEYTFDNANRLTQIIHRSGGETALQLNYTYTENNLIDVISENGGAASTDFTYDNCGRLIGEERQGQYPYHIAYEYDQLGNRLVQRSFSGSRTTFYHYAGNRLVYYKTYLGLYADEPADDEDLEKATWYRYDYLTGNVSRIVSKEPGDNYYHGLALAYDRDDRLWIMVGDQWQAGAGGVPFDHQPQWAREYRYGFDGRQRILERERFVCRTQFPNWAWVDVPEPEEGIPEHQYSAFWLDPFNVGLLTWEQAQAYATSFGGNLVCVEDQDEYDWLTEPGRVEQLGGFFWLGARQSSDASTPDQGWAWVDDGELFESTPFEEPWYDGQPDDGDGVEGNDEWDEDVAAWDLYVFEGWWDVPEQWALDQIVIERNEVYDQGQEEPLYPGEDGDGNAQWQGYLFDLPYDEFTVDAEGHMIHGRRWFGSTAYVDDGAEPVYAHHDHVGTTRLLSQTGQDPSDRVFTAFGAPIHSAGPNASRYGYVGGHGYEDLPGAPFLHVGERWYDPATGRFLQRDPIGIWAGLNVYAYVGNNPVSAADPSGLDRWLEYSSDRPVPHAYLVLGSAQMGYYRVEFAPVDANDSTLMMVLRGIASFFAGTEGATVITRVSRPSGPPDAISTDAQDLGAMHDASKMEYYHAIFRNCHIAAREILRSNLTPVRPPTRPPPCSNYGLNR